MPDEHFDTHAADYAFFESHSTEAQKDVEAIAPMFPGKPVDQIQVLDFGCGTGNFTQGLFKYLDLEGPLKALHLVDPAEQSRATAAGKLASFAHRLLESSSLVDVNGEFDFVLANHSLYFVDDLKWTLQRLAGLCSPKGTIVVSIAGQSSYLIGIWKRAFEGAGKKLPYFLSEDVTETAELIGLKTTRTKVTYAISFEASEVHFDKILRFLLPGDVITLLREELVEEFYKPYLNDGRFSVSTEHDLYQLRT